jgi:hypothetical protein
MASQSSRTRILSSCPILLLVLSSLGPRMLSSLEPSPSFVGIFNTHILLWFLLDCCVSWGTVETWISWQACFQKGKWQDPLTLWVSNSQDAYGRIANMLAHPVFWWEWSLALFHLARRLASGGGFSRGGFLASKQVDKEKSPTFHSLVFDAYRYNYRWGRPREATSNKIRSELQHWISCGSASDTGSIAYCKRWQQRSEILWATYLWALVGQTAVIVNELIYLVTCFFTDRQCCTYCTPDGVRRPQY